MNNFLTTLLFAVLILFACSVEAVKGEMKGNSYHIEGMIQQDTLTDFIKHMHKIDRVILKSDGGEVVPALTMGRLIRYINASTIVPRGSDCSSACGYIFMGGEYRRLFGRLGLHEFSLGLVPYSKMRPRQRDMMIPHIINIIRYMEDMGVKEDYLTHSLLVPSQYMYYINEDQFKTYLINPDENKSNLHLQLVLGVLLLLSLIIIYKFTIYIKKRG